jgi:hypothetical protein
MTLQKTEIRENIEWTNFRWHNAPDLVKPRILLIGDSIVVGHGSLVHDLIQDDYCVDYLATAKCVSDVDFMTELDYMLSQREYTLVIFNNGLHGFDIEDQVYIAHLREALTDLKSRVKRLVWRNSTSIRDKEDLNQFAERNFRVILRNKAAATIAQELALPVIDLYAPMSEQVDLFSPDAIHYNEEGKQYQAELLARHIRAMIG